MFDDLRRIERWGKKNVQKHFKDWDLLEKRTKYTKRIFEFVNTLLNNQNQKEQKNVQNREIVIHAEFKQKILK